MATYVLGDIHGCFRTLQALLERIRFDAEADYLWLVGDLVNRGPSSLAVLRWARKLEEAGRLVTVLGNHDVHLLSRGAGVAKAKRGDALEEVLKAPDREELLDWLRQRPLLHRSAGNAAGDWVMAHAGIHPAWDLDTAERAARTAEAVLRGADWKDLLAAYREDDLPPWSPDLPARQRARWGLAVFSLIRTVRGDGSLDRRFAGPPQDIPAGREAWLTSWDQPATALFGHWAALGLHLLPGLLCLDSGCAWGGPLTAFRLEDGALFQEGNRDQGRTVRHRDEGVQ